jgi:hypothetical protein
MKCRSLHLVLLLTILLGGDPTYAQDPLGATPKKPRTPDDYKPRALKELAQGWTGAGSRGNKMETMVVHADVLPSRVRATYAGSARPLPRIRKEVIRQWARLYAGFPEGYTRPYETEMLFTEEGSRYWLAVRKESLPRLGGELKRGELLVLYLIRVGAVKAGGGWEPVLLIESFERPN